MTRTVVGLKGTRDGPITLLRISEVVEWAIHSADHFRVPVVPAVTRDDGDLAIDGLVDELF
jgi:hypothetical protein